MAVRDQAVLIATVTVALIVLMIAFTFLFEKGPWRPGISARDYRVCATAAVENSRAHGRIQILREEVIACGAES